VLGGADQGMGITAGSAAVAARDDWLLTESRLALNVAAIRTENDRGVRLWERLTSPIDTVTIMEAPYDLVV